ncbi:cytochrome C oxidase subunit IV family protein [Agrobacterium sp. Ap1]|nr:cytochrome C oxidase subunit IV family protein [Agrobacterium sp. Ap1]
MHDTRFPMLGTFILVLVLAIGGATIAALSDGNPIAIGTVLLIAFVKARFVILDFMELRHGQRGMALSLLAWCALLLLVTLARPLLVSYLT